MIFFDTETCGLHGMPVLIQWCHADNPKDIKLHNIWTQPIRNTLELIEKFVNEPGGVCGFNLTFDWFMLCKAYTVLSLYPDFDAEPQDIIDELGILEKDGRDGPCLKPVKALDLMLHARKGPYQSTMDRKDIRIKRVPTGLAWQLAEELERRIPLKDVYFARRKDKTVEKWKVMDIKDEEGKMNVDFKDVVLAFAPSSALKALAQDALGVQDEDLLLFTDIEVDRRFLPVESGWAPWATSQQFARPGHWEGTWPEVIRHHIIHWEFHQLARKYALKDVEYTYGLWEFFGKPQAGDNDSELACMVAAVRWRGFRVNIEAIKKLRAAAIVASKRVATDPKKVRDYIFPLMSREEQLSMYKESFSKVGSTDKNFLETLDKRLMVDCPDCEGEGWFPGETSDHPKIKCAKCDKDGEIKHPAAIRAREVIDARAATKEVELYDKIIQAGRLHAGFKVIGALSGRMSGDSGLNPQAIKKTTVVRECFLLAPEGYVLCGGDFESFEIMIAIANYNDDGLYRDVTELHACPVCKSTGKVTKRNKETGEEKEGKCGECEGTGSMKKKIHGLFAEALFPEEDYESILLTKGSVEDLYGKGKTGVFSQLFGGDENTLVRKNVVKSKDDAQDASERWKRKYPGIKKAQKRISDGFQSMRQPNGPGSRVYWHQPDDKIETMLGFPRYFTLENAICKALFDLAEKPPKEWEKVKVRVSRNKDREQWAAGAVKSALYGAAFGVQGCNTRAATNHVIQGTGAGITKQVQRNIWNLQPAGIHEFNVMPMNIHDEIHAPCLPNMVSEVTKVVNATVEEFKKVVPLLSLPWGENLRTWADK